MAAGTCTYIICINIYAIGRQIPSSASLSGGLIIGCFFCLQVDEPIFRGGGLIIGCIFLCKGMDLYLRGGAYKWGGGL